MPYLSRCNIACGGHAGDADTMAEALSLARRHGVMPGAHPSYPDRQSFGRARPAGGTERLADSLRAQLRDLKALADARNIRLAHVKPHGALYHDALTDPALAALIAEVTHSVLPGAALVHMPGSRLAEEAARRGMAFLAEGFIDRAYLANGDLAPRGQPGAMIDTRAERVNRALALAAGRPIPTLDGKTLTLRVDTVCLHGDSEGAAASARDIVAALTEAGHTLAPAMPDRQA